MYKAKNDNLLIEVEEENKTKFAGEKQKPWYRAKVVSIGALVKGKYEVGEIVLVTPHATTLIKDNVYVVREGSVLVAEN